MTTHPPRELILGRIRRALGDVHVTETPDDVAVPRDYRRSEPSELHEAASPAVVELFAGRAAEYRAEITRCAAREAGPTIARVLARNSIAALVVPPGFPDALIPRDTTCATLHDEPTLSVGTLDAAHAVISTCAVAIAETGTIILDAGPGQGRRALTLMPDFHLCLVSAEQIVATVPDAIARLEPARPITMISGPSATSDIENNRVEGVHGPRTLHILLIEPDPLDQNPGGRA